MKIFVITIFFTSIICFLNSCSEEPNSVGESVLPKKDIPIIYEDSIKAISDTTYLHRISGNSKRLLLGVYENISAFTLLKFGGFKSLMQKDSIISAKLKFKINYCFKDTSGTITFNIHEITKNWEEATFTWDSLTYNDFYNYPHITTFSSTLRSGDSIEVNIEPLVRKWVKDSIDSPHGVILIPTHSQTNVIVGFNNESISLKPYLKVVYRDTNNTNDSLIFILLQSTFVANAEMKEIPSIKQIQAGLAYRYAARFNQNYFEKLRNVSITEAILQISVDTNFSLHNNYSDKQLAAYYTNEMVPPFSYLAYGTYCTYNDSQKIFTSDVKNIVQQWVIKNPNPIIVLRAISETYSADRFALYGTTSPDTLKPRLIIKYTVLPQ